ncbi:U1 small nuclear ribonucleoprotein A [Cyclospora cayetanensis]|uniref:U1 small nuclear ribonucleoprotein A n=1 Tax=Cyclospora cayetanensis TaxID=88456 RepID=A0A6P6RW54_9EIME|nr:U1 small nuclear ribonucleoprotein A [Cyclospora cayetanensis]
MPFGPGASPQRPGGGMMVGGPPSRGHPGAPGVTMGGMPFGGRMGGAPLMGMGGGPHTFGGPPPMAGGAPMGPPAPISASVAPMGGPMGGPGAAWGPVAPEMAAVGMTAVNLKRLKYLQPRAVDSSIPPNCTIYVSNINDRIKLKELKENLKSMFKQFGEIRQIVAMGSFWRRGQAWIVFKDETAATTALNGMQGFIYHGQPLHINYALAKSDLVAKEDGTFTERPSGPRKPRRVREKEAQQRALFLQLQQQYLALKGPGGLPPQATGSTDPAALVAAAQARQQQQQQQQAGADTTAAGASQGSAEGLVDIRAILFKKVAFVEYATEELATKALNSQPSPFWPPLSESTPRWEPQKAFQLSAQPCAGILNANFLNPYSLCTD